MDNIKQKNSEKTCHDRLMSEEYEPGLVSAIIPSYNRADLVGRAIQSALNQTYQHFEIIVVDDGSTDDTEEIVKGFSDPRIHYLRHEQNKGGSAARNTGIKASIGEYIAFLDSDCEWFPEKLEKQLKIFGESSCKLGAVGAGTTEIRNNTAKIRNFDGEFGDIYKKLLSCKAGWPGGTPNIIIKRECFKKVGLFDELLESVQDFDLYIRIAEYYHFDVVREPLVKVNEDTPDGISSNSEAILMGRKRLLEKYSKKIPQRCRLRSLYNYRIGRILCHQGKMKEGRKYLFKAITSHLYGLKKWTYFLISFFPFKFYRCLRYIKHKARDLILFFG